MHIQTKLDLAAHLSVAVIGSAVIYAFTRDYFDAAVFASGGILIDLDHLVDYFLFFKARFDISKFVNHSYLDGGKTYLFLHSWELVAAVAAAAAWTRVSALAFLAGSLALHLAVDNVQRRRRLMYFLTYRVIKKFDARFLLPEYFEYIRSRNAGSSGK